MSSVWTIAARDFKSYFSSPVAYVVLIAFVMVNGYFFTLALFLTREANMQFVLRSMGLLLIFLMPAITMRSLAEEKRSATLDLILACPVRDWEVVLGKYLGSLAFYGVMLISTLHFPLLLGLLGCPDYLPIIVGYVGCLLLGAAVLATGLWSSSLTQNQVVAYVIAFGMLMLVWAADRVSAYVGHPFTDILKSVAMSSHYSDFAWGVLDTRHIVYYLSWTITFLGLTVHSLSLRRWL